MSNLFELTKKLHQTIQEKAEKHGLETKIKNIFRECEYFFYEIFDVEGTITQRLSSVYLYEPIGRREPPFKRLCPAIQAPQIRQILLAFKEVLGESEEIKELNIKNTPNRFYVDELCSRWLDGLEPLFVREPETVLTELLEILKNI
jgi:hypothetical protein